jgi:hypothetical protein
MQMGMSILVAFSPPFGGNDKHQEWQSKYACQVAVSNGSNAN